MTTIKEKLDRIYSYKFESAQDYIDRLKPITDTLITTLEEQKAEIELLIKSIQIGDEINRKLRLQKSNLRVENEGLRLANEQLRLIADESIVCPFELT